LKILILLPASLSAILMTVASAAIANSLPEVGSVVIVLYSRDEIVMAADSRVVNEQTGQYRDDYCKIITPGDEFIYGATGITETAGAFNAAGLIRRLFREEGRHREDGFVQGMARKWTHAMEQNLAKLPSNRLRQSAGEGRGAGALNCAMFVGVETSGELALARARLFYRGVSAGGIPRVAAEITPIPLDKPGINIAGCGDVDVLESIVPPRTAWAKSEVERWQHFTGDAKASIAIRLVQLTIDHERPRRFGFQEIVPVGGEIDAAEIVRERPVKWIQRKANCPAE
jgi:hypothetical protein